MLPDPHATIVGFYRLTPYSTPGRRHAANNLRRWSVVFLLPNDRHPHFLIGVINITDGRPYGCNTFYGRIDLQGGLVAGRGMVDEVQDFLTTFDAQPELVATAYGHRVGTCCYCSRDLTDRRSVDKGIDPEEIDEA